MTTFKPYPELIIDKAEDGTTRITTKGGEDVCVSIVGRPEDMQRIVDCWNACRKLYAPAAHIEATDAHTLKTENLRKEAWSMAAALQAELDQRGTSTVAGVGAEWNHDILSAPRDAKIWLAAIDGVVVGPTSWDKKRGQWAGFATNGTPPIAWQAYVVPAHPNSPKKAIETMGGTGDDCSFGNRGVWPPQGGASSSRGNDSLSVVTAGETAPLITHKHIFLDTAGSVA